MGRLNLKKLTCVGLSLAAVVLVLHLWLSQGKSPLMTPPVNSDGGRDAKPESNKRLKTSQGHVVMYLRYT